MMKFEVYNDNSLINFSNSILKHYGVETFHNSIPEVDKALKDYQKIVVMLFDGMGQNIIRKHLKENSFIRSHYLTTINSTFPPTTTAATTSFLTGKYPVETGWIAWDVYLEEFKRNVVLFKNTDYNTFEELGDETKQFIDERLKIKTILELLKEKDPSMDIIDMKRKPISPDGPATLRESRSLIKKNLKDSKKCFIYYYFDSPDYEMHALGIDKKAITRKVRYIDRLVKHIVKDNPDTAFMTFADHGHVNVKYLDLCEHSDLLDLLKSPVSGEKRASFFFVKDGMQSTFAELFNKYYGNEFVLLSHEEVLNINLFGLGEKHKQFQKFIGDFVAISIGEYALLAQDQFKEAELFPGHHAGGTKEERLIDISFFAPKK